MDHTVCCRYDILGDEANREQGMLAFVAVIMLWLSTVFTTIFIVNLMIAQVREIY